MCGRWHSLCCNVIDQSYCATQAEKRDKEGAGVSKRRTITGAEAQQLVARQQLQQLHGGQQQQQWQQWQHTQQQQQQQQFFGSSLPSHQQPLAGGVLSGLVHGGDVTALGMVPAAGNIVGPGFVGRLGSDVGLLREQEGKQSLVAAGPGGVSTHLKASSSTAAAIAGAAAASGSADGRCVGSSFFSPKVNEGTSELAAVAGEVAAVEAQSAAGQDSQLVTRSSSSGRREFRRVGSDTRAPGAVGLQQLVDQGISSSAPTGSNGGSNSSSSSSTWGAFGAIEALNSMPAVVAQAIGSKVEELKVLGSQMGTVLGPDDGARVPTLEEAAQQKRAALMRRTASLSERTVASPVSQGEQQQLIAGVQQQKGVEPKLEFGAGTTGCSVNAGASSSFRRQDSSMGSGSSRSAVSRSSSGRTLAAEGQETSAAAGLAADRNSSERLAVQSGAGNGGQAGTKEGPSRSERHALLQLLEAKASLLVKKMAVNQQKHLSFPLQYQTYVHQHQSLHQGIGASQCTAAAAAAGLRNQEAVAAAGTRQLARCMTSPAPDRNCGSSSSCTRPWGSCDNGGVTLGHQVHLGGPGIHASCWSTPTESSAAAWHSQGRTNAGLLATGLVGSRPRAVSTSNCVMQMLPERDRGSVGGDNKQQLAPYTAGGQGFGYVGVGAVVGGGQGSMQHECQSQGASPAKLSGHMAALNASLRNPYY